MNYKDKKHIAIIHPSGKNRIDDKRKLERIQNIKNLGFDVTEILPNQVSYDGVTAAPIMERAAQLGYALTMRRFNILIAARGGMGCTEIIPFLENILPPVIPEKTLIGFSDISFIGVYLSLRYPNFRYIHGQNAFSPNFFNGPMIDQKCLIELLNDIENEYTFPVKIYNNINKFSKANMAGVCVPLNLSLAESLASLKYIEFPKNNILFIEECNEHLYRIIRKLDALINSELIKNTKAIVLGNFSDCLDSNEKPLNREFLIQIISKKLNIPVIDFPLFGHDEFRFPLVM